ncbi:MAG: helix-turn-helix domain-containing protein [Gemmatimonas sp.]
MGQADKVDDLKEDRIRATDAAKIVGLSVAGLYYQARKDNVPHWKIGRNFRFSRRALEEFVASGGTHSAAA